MTAESWIIDGYVDEPACLGVPPYLSPYIRTIAGVMVESGYNVRYCTVDQMRSDTTYIRDASHADLVVMIAGVTVPGKYLGGTPASYTDIRQIGSALATPVTFLGGPVLFGMSTGGGVKAVRSVDFGFDHLLEGYPAEALHSYLSGSEPVGNLSYEDEDRWNILGSGILTQHPLYPYVMCEIETARGCPRSRSGGCSFCTEPFYGEPRYRSVAGIASEVAALYRSGARHFRLGRQPDLLSYQSGAGENPRPVPDKISDLFHAVRTAAPELRTLHIDNVNPGTIARYPEESREALEAIIRYHTPGDVAAFGMETADPAVVEANNLKADPEMVLEAIRIVNEAGSVRREGIPELLPGLNFIAGLAGETANTYRLNIEFLERVAGEGLLIRRVNIRQLMPFEGTKAWDANTLPVDEGSFRTFKEEIRKSFDLPMLRKVFPTGTILHQVIIEESGDLSYGRQLGSYPILVGIPLRLSKGSQISCTVVDHGMRSITALPWPIPINSLPVKTLKWIPGIQKKAMVKILAKRPFNSREELETAAGCSFPPDLFSFISPAAPSQ
ncbi:MAG TPA: radical SAM protein [Methanospirillum sp.]|nr:radical SAM protein [Methanospirillum sp.]